MVTIQQDYQTKSSIIPYARKDYSSLTIILSIMGIGSLSKIPKSNDLSIDQQCHIDIRDQQYTIATAVQSNYTRPTTTNIATSPYGITITEFPYLMNKSEANKKKRNNGKRERYAPNQTEENKNRRKERKKEKKRKRKK